MRPLSRRGRGRRGLRVNPDEGPAWAVEVRGVMGQQGAGQRPRTLHLIPSGSGWVLVANESSQRGEEFADLGQALDAATRGDGAVRVVVHERGS